MSYKMSGGARAILKLLKKLRPAISTDDIDSQRQMQDDLILLVKPSKKVRYERFDMDGVFTSRMIPKAHSGSKKTILHCHGGAFVAGTLQYCEILASRLSELTGMDTYTYEYRLAPEHPYPAALQDTQSIYGHMLLRGHEARDIILLGESAGGNLVLALCHWLKSRGMELPGAIVCLSPWTDLTCSGESFRALQEIDATLDGDVLKRCTRLYAPKEALQQPLLSPLFADHTGYPRTLVQVGGSEILRDDSIRLADSMLQAGVDCTLQEYKGMCHVFQMYPFKESKYALEAIAAFIRQEAEA
ncbi:MAG: alpha/beta hydrolase [Christensenellales bacterium]|jgi:monoterpene epsilon-lactone hydrolase